MAYPSRAELYRLVLDHLFGLATQKPIQDARRCGPQRASQVVGEVVYQATGGRGPRRPPAAVVAYLLAQQETRPVENTPEAFYWQERRLSTYKS